MRKLKIDMSDLEAAFATDQMSGMNYYLDLESGQVLMTTENDRRAADEFFEEMASEEDENELHTKFEKWLEEYDCPDWQVDSIRNAFVIEREFLDRFIHIPKQESRDGYNDMVDFAETATNNRLRELLSVALNGRGAFRRFKDVLHNYPEDRQRFFEFSDRRLKDRIMEWLADEGIELEGRDE